ncbi:MAG TPA: hypothetical protein VGK67_33960 [Myxococcales bacterium]|jgi:hypothetical protein
MRRELLTLVALAALCACRSFEMPPEPAPPDTRRTVGVACSEPEECLSGVCADGLCCEGECASWEVCNAAGHQGRCTSRKPGEACGRDADCPPGDAGAGFCRDQVCCSSACLDPCTRCDVEGHAGECLLAPDDTDARNDCGADCQMCFLGRCAPARVGNGRKCGEGKGCSASGQCLVMAGGSCLSDADCAVGHCLEALCVVDEVQKVFVEPMSAMANLRTVVDVAANDEGDISVLFTESVAASVYGINDSMLAMKVGGTWTVRRVQSDLFATTGWVPGAAEYLGRSVYTATYRERQTGTCGGVEGPPCGLVGQLWGMDGRTTGFEVIDSAAYPEWIKLVVDGEGSLFAVHMGSIQDGGDGIFALRRGRVASGWDRTRVRLHDQLAWVGSFGEVKEFYASVVALPRGIVLFTRDDAEDARDSNLVAKIWDGESAAPEEIPAALPTFPGDSVHCFPSRYIESKVVSDGTVLVALECQGWDVYAYEILFGLFDPVRKTWSFTFPSKVGSDYVAQVQPLYWAGGRGIFGLQTYDKDGDLRGMSVGWLDEKGWNLAAGFQAEKPASPAWNFSSASPLAHRGVVAFTLRYVTQDGSYPYGFTPDLMVLRYSDRLDGPGSR